MWQVDSLEVRQLNSDLSMCIAFMMVARYYISLNEP